MTGRTDRLAPVVAAKRAADQARLAACLAEQRRQRSQAEELRETARAAAPAGDAAGMAETARWQGALVRTARRLLADAAALEPDLAGLRARLARSLGRERAVDALLAAERDAARKTAARREEDAVPVIGEPPGAGAAR